MENEIATKEVYSPYLIGYLGIYGVFEKNRFINDNGKCYFVYIDNEKLREVVDMYNNDKKLKYYMREVKNIKMAFKKALNKWNLK